MTSMRIDGGADQKLWAKRLAKLLREMREDGCQFAATGDAVFVYKNSDEPTRVDVW